MVGKLSGCLRTVARWELMDSERFDSLAFYSLGGEEVGDLSGCTMTVACCGLASWGGITRLC